jgi:hypothetical protein
VRRVTESIVADTLWSYTSIRLALSFGILSTRGPAVIEPPTTFAGSSIVAFVYVAV